MPGPPAVYLAENRRKSRRVSSGRFWQRQGVCQKFLQGVKWTQWTEVAGISANGRGFDILMLKTSWEIMAPSESVLVVDDEEDILELLGYNLVVLSNLNSVVFISGSRRL
jgi:hypothetical protein